jgi:hypothetical protein
MRGECDGLGLGVFGLLWWIMVWRRTEERGTSTANVALMRCWLPAVLVTLRQRSTQRQGEHHMNSVCPYLIDSYSTSCCAVLAFHSLPSPS